MIQKDISLRGKRRTFIVHSIQTNASTPSAIARFQEATQVKIATGEAEAIQFDGDLGRPKLEVSNVAGLDMEVMKINELLRAFDGQKLMLPWVRRSCAILLHGAHGTGKSLIMTKIMETGWGKVFKITPETKPSYVRQIFTDAKMQPSIVIIDKLDQVISKEHARSYAVDEVLGEELDNLVGDHPEDSLPRVVVIGATSEPGDISREMRKIGRFDTEVGLPVPDTKARKSILRSLVPSCKPNEKDELLERLGDRTHAYVGADLALLVSTAGRIAERRLRAAGEGKPETGHGLIQDDVDKALLVVRPTAMRDVVLEPPKVRWDEIGGQGDVKKALRRAVERPLLV